MTKQGKKDRIVLIIKTVQHLNNHKKCTIINNNKRNELDHERKNI